MAGYPKIIHTEEGMRDGLQIENADIPIAAKIRLLNALSETGLKEINVGSFVSPKYTPQMAKVDELMQGFTPKPASFTPLATAFATTFGHTAICCACVRLVLRCANTSHMSTRVNASLTFGLSGGMYSFARSWPRSFNAV